MDNQRLLIWAFFGLMLWLAFQAWQQDYGAKPPPAAAATETPSPTVTPGPMKASAQIHTWSSTTMGENVCGIFGCS